MAADYGLEIQQLHRFFQDYFGGTLAQSAVTRFDQLIAPAFMLIDSQGRITDAAAIKEIIRGLHGQRRAIRIWTDNILLRHESHDLLLATYEEWQEQDGRTTQRFTTVVFQKAADAPGGLLWLHVHESGLHEVTP